MNHHHNYAKVLKAFITGLAIGSAAALLLTPYSGKKMRRLAKQKGQDALDEAKDRYDDFESNTLRPGFEKAREKGMDAYNSTRGELKGLRAKVAKTFRKAEGQLDDVTDELS